MKTKIDPSEMFAGAANQRSPASFVRFLVIAGLVNASIAAVLLCRLPASHAPTLSGLLIRAILYVGLGAFAGTAGVWWYWRRASASMGPNLPLPFSLFALTCATGWVWVPAVVLLAGQDTPVTSVVAAIGAAILAVGLRRAIPSLHDQAAAVGGEEKELFAETLYTAPREAHGYVIAGCLYIAAVALDNREHLMAGTLFGLSAILFMWQSTLPHNQRIHNRDRGPPGCAAIGAHCDTGSSNYAVGTNGWRGASGQCRRSKHRVRARKWINRHGREREEPAAGFCRRSRWLRKHRALA